ncbi:vomeronasal type-1 receptor 1-like [Rhynchocyon petersi]
MRCLSMSFRNNPLSITGQVTLKIILLFQVGVGTLVNVIFFFHNAIPIFLGHRLRPTHVILAQIAVANCLILLSTGIPYTMAAFDLRDPLSTLGCKLVYCIRRMARNITLCSTCILSTYQLVILKPKKVVWAVVPGRANKVISPSCCICWMFSVLTNISSSWRITGPQNIHNDTHTQGKWFCSYIRLSAGTVILWFSVDSMFIGLMIWASGSMVVLLQRHHRRVQYIHPFDCSHRHPPEIRATHAILMLVTTFVAFYTLNSIVNVYITASLNTQLWLMHASHILSSCFPTVSPLLLILQNPRAARFYS